MSIILAESVAVAKSKLTKGFNGDSLNLDGRVVPIEGADKGFKAAGSVKPPYAAVVSSSNRKGFANGAVTAFNDYVKNISDNISSSQQMFESYFDDMRTVAEKCEIPDSTLSIGAVTVCSDCVIAAKTGKTHLLRYSDGELFEVAISEDEDGKGYQLIDTVNDGDIFAIVSDEAAENLDYDGIMNIFASGKDLKSMVNDFFTLLPVNDGKDCTVVLIRLKVRDVAPVVIPAAVKKAEPVKPLDTATDDELEDFATQDKNKLGKKKIIGLIPLLALVAILAVFVGLYAASHFGTGNEGEDNSDLADSPVFEDGTDDETTTESDTAEDETTTAEEETTVAEETTTDVTEENTTRAPETTTRAPETTTRPPVTTTQPPVTTTQPPVTTTEPPVTTTEAPTTTEPAEPTTERVTKAPPDWWDIEDPYY